MCFFFSFVPATFWVAVGYFVLFSSTKAQGGVRTFGRILAIWTFIIAAVLPMVGAYVTLAGLYSIVVIMALHERRAHLVGPCLCFCVGPHLLQQNGVFACGALKLIS